MKWLLTFLLITFLVFPKIPQNTPILKAKKINNKIVVNGVDDEPVWASILIANAGYDPFAIARMAKKLAAQPKPKVDIFDTEYLAPDDAKTRAEKIEKFTNKEFSKKKPGATMPERFQYYMKKS